MEYLEKPLFNEPIAPYLDWIKMGHKTYEGRLASKAQEWKLHLGKRIKFYDQCNPKSWVLVEVTELLYFKDFGQTFDRLGSRLIPGKSKNEVILLYNELFKLDGEQVNDKYPCLNIIWYNVIAIGFKVIFYQ